MILKSLLITTLLFSFSIRSNLFYSEDDYEVMLGGRGQHLEIKLDKEREDNKQFFNKLISYNIGTNWILDFNYIDLEEDYLKLVNIGLLKKVKVFNLGLSTISRNDSPYKISAYLQYKNDFMDYNILIVEDGSLHNLNLRYSHKITKQLSLVHTASYYRDPQADSYKSKVIFEYKLKKGVRDEY